MEVNDFIVWTILILTGISTYTALETPSFFERYNLNPKMVLRNKEYDRMLSSGFLHADWMHFAINMYLFFILSPLVIDNIGAFSFVLLYFGSMLAASALGVYLHKSESFYRAVGASGAVMGVLFAYILISPNATFLLFFILPLPGWLLGLFYVGYSIYGIETKGKDQIAHDAHLAGGAAGLLILAFVQPDLYQYNGLYAVVMLLPLVGYLIYKNKDYFKGKSDFPSSLRGYTNLDDRFNETKAKKQKELDELLDKVSKKGLDSLSDKEKKRLDELSSN